MGHLEPGLGLFPGSGSIYPASVENSPRVARGGELGAEGPAPLISLHTSQCAAAAGWRWARSRPEPPLAHPRGLLPGTCGGRGGPKDSRSSSSRLLLTGVWNQPAGSVHSPLPPVPLVQVFKGVSCFLQLRGKIVPNSCFPNPPIALI